MYLTQSAKELAKYKLIAQKALSNLPPQISYKLIQIDDYNLSFRVYFNDVATNFWVHDDGSILYNEPVLAIRKRVNKADLLQAYYEQSRDFDSNL